MKEDKPVSSYFRFVRIYASIFLFHLHLISFSQGLRFVNPTGVDIGECDLPGNPCLTINYAIDHANPNDTIRISEGVFTEPDGITIDKSLVFHGAGKYLTIIQAHEESKLATNRVVTIDGEYDLSIIGATIRHGYAKETGTASLGGGIYCDGANLILKDVAIFRNTAEYNGGGIYGIFSKITLSETDIEENVISGIVGGGGGIYLSHSKGDFINSSIAKDTTSFTGFGGGALLLNSLVIMDYCEILRNYASDGGGIYIGGGTFLLSNSFIVENTASYSSGGGIDAGADTLIIKSSLISGNHADFGGGLYLAGGYQEFNEVDIRFNQSGSIGGGGIYNYNSTPRFEDVFIESNFSYGNGGGMVNDVNVPYTLTGVTFRYNESQEFGGGLNQRGDSLSIQHVVFEQNKAGYGGGLYVSGATTLDHCSFIKNQAKDSGGGMNFNGPLHISNSSFTENTANAGGGLCAEGTFSNRQYPYLDQVIFTGNSAVYGGGMSNTSFSYPKLESVEFDSNTAEFGGGFFNRGGTPIFSNVLFDNNAGAYGGGIYHYVDLITAINTVFTRNVATTAGGAIYNSGDENHTWMEGKIKLINATLSQNDSPLGGALYNIYNSHVDILNSVIWNNKGADGRNIFNNEISSADLKYSLCGDEIADVAVGERIEYMDCLHTDPMFVSTNDYRLTAASPCINSGDPNTDKGLFTGGPTDPLDFDLHPRIINSGIDMGAFESQEIVSIERDDPENHILIFPNPASSFISVMALQNIHSITVRNLAGQILSEDGNIGGQQKQIDISTLPDGLYMLNIGLEKSCHSFKILKRSIP